MSSAEPVTVAAAHGAEYTAPQRRIIAAALDLFARHGVSGTSLQMIADAVGVTKAAVYHQFQTKDEIVLAAAELDMARLESALDAAEAAEATDDRSTVLDLLLTRLIDLALDHRRMVSMLHGDPVMARLLVEHEPFRRLMDRLLRLLAGDDPDGDGRVPAAMLSAAINGAMFHPFLADVDDDTLRATLLDLARRFLGLPPSPTTTPGSSAAG